MGGKKNNKKKKEMGQENTQSSDAAQGSGTAPKSTNQQGSDNRPKSDVDQKICAEQFAKLSISSQNQQQPISAKAPEKKKEARQQSQKQVQKQPAAQPTSTSAVHTVPETSLPSVNQQSNPWNKGQNLADQVKHESDMQPSKSGASGKKKDIQQNPKNQVNPEQKKEARQQSKKQAQKQSAAQPTTTSPGKTVSETSLPSEKQQANPWNKGQNQPKQKAGVQPSTSVSREKPISSETQEPSVWNKRQGQPKQKSDNQPSTSNAARQQSQQGQNVSQAQPSNKPTTKVTTQMPHLLCPYKGPGTRGLKFKSLLETNYLKLKIDNMKDSAIHYDVTIEPDKPKKNMPKIFQQFCMNNFPNVGIAYDGSRSAYSPIRLTNLENLEREVDFIHPETLSVRKYIVNIKETDNPVIPLTALRTYRSTRQYDAPQRALQCIEVILKGAFQQAHLEKGIQAGRSFYIPQPYNNRIYLDDFFELWLGLFQSTVLGSNIYLNVDISHKGFPERYDSLVDMLQQMCKEYRCDVREAVDRMRRHLSGMDVIYKSPSAEGNMKIYKFMDLVAPPDKVTFTDREGRRFTVAEYFKSLNYSITRPDLPCVKLGNSIKSIIVPMEHCSLPDRQAVNKKCTENQTRKIIKEAATTTDIRKNKIMAMLDLIRHNQSPIIRGFGLEVDANFAKVQARRLTAPGIVYGNNKQVEVKNGAWRGEGMPFLIPESANKWAILNVNQRTRNDELQELATSFYRTSAPTNLNLAPKPTFVHCINNRDNIDIAIRKELEFAKSEEIRILFCIIPDSGPTYAKIKQIAETRIGVLTQCIKGGTVFKKRKDGSTISNILLKCNAKLNGTNHRLNDSPILKDKCMLIGGDVTHPSAELRGTPSVVGVAASHDANAFCYNVCWRLQGPRVEIIQDFQQIIVDHLRFYLKKNGHLPNKILYYRDGVSEGQFQQVMASERQAMTRACAEMEPGYERKVKITIIIVQKRHHTRFFPGKTEIGSGDRNNNVPAGTIVDTEITHPNENHFYLVSHQSIQGVAKPTKYCILLDEANHSIDDLQGLSYNLCHLFSRCNRSVSYPAPTYYAHLAAYRGRVYIENSRLNMDNLTTEWQNRAIHDHIVRDHPMFFV